MSSLEIFEGPLEALLQGPEVQQHLATRTDDLVVLVKLTLSRPYPGGRNPPPGPPYRRSGDLHDSITAVAPQQTGDGLVAGVAATAVHRGVRYGNVLLDRGYQFLDFGLLA